MYSSLLLDHFEHPRNAGEIDGADAVAEVENPACGDILRLTLKLDAGRIVEIRFKAKGCVPSMACASAITELAMGKTIPEAQAINEQDIVHAVAGLPQASTHAARLALDTLFTALKQAHR